jgi:phasin family protein
MADTKTETPVAKAEAAAPAARDVSAPAAAPKAASRAVAAPKAAAAAKPAVKAAAKTAKPARKAVRKTRQAARTATNQIDKGSKTMTNEAKKAGERFQTAFGDVNAQTKTAIERNTKLAEELTALTQGNVEALVASSRVAAKGAEKIGQDVAEYSRKSFEQASSALKTFADVKSPADLLRLQADFVRTQFDSAVAESSKLSEQVIKLAGEVAQPLTNRYSVAAERVKSAVAF